MESILQNISNEVKENPERLEMIARSIDKQYLSVSKKIQQMIEQSYAKKGQSYNEKTHYQEDEVRKVDTEIWDALAEQVLRYCGKDDKMKKTFFSIRQQELFPSSHNLIYNNPNRKILSWVPIKNGEEKFPTIASRYGEWDMLTGEIDGLSAMLTTQPQSITVSIFNQGKEECIFSIDQEGQCWQNFQLKKIVAPIHYGQKTPQTIHTLNKHFPGSLSGHDVNNIVCSRLKMEGFTSDNTIFAESACPDEVNHDDPDEDIGMIFQREWGEVFNIGGLSGLPFCGKTGWLAFSSHVPIDGHICIIFAPHIGISSMGEIGELSREGQDGTSTCCGAAIGAWNAIKDNYSNFKPKLEYYQDQQFETIKMFLSKIAPKILSSSDNTNKILAFSLFDIIKQFLEDMLTFDWMGPNSKLAVLGGIMINCEGAKTDMFCPLSFELISQKGESRVDLLQDCFGTEARKAFDN